MENILKDLFELNEKSFGYKYTRNIKGAKEYIRIWVEKAEKNGYKCETEEKVLAEGEFSFSSEYTNRIIKTKYPFVFFAKAKNEDFNIETSTPFLLKLSNDVTKEENEKAKKFNEKYIINNKKELEEKLLKNEIEESKNEIEGMKNKIKELKILV